MGVSGVIILEIIFTNKPKAAEFLRFLGRLIVSVCHRLREVESNEN
jgi:hypothetical protein